MYIRRRHIWPVKAKSVSKCVRAEVGTRPVQSALPVTVCCCPPATSRYLGVLILFCTTNRSDKDVFNSLASCRQVSEQRDRGHMVGLLPQKRTEGLFDVTHCIMKDRACGEGVHCVIHEAWEIGQRVILEYLATQTLADFAFNTTSRTLPPAS